MPLIILLIIVVDLLSFLLLFVDYKLWREWHEFRNTTADDYARNCLYGAVALLAYGFAGRYVIMLLLSKVQRKDEAPSAFQSDKSSILTRPDGTKLYVEEFGNPAGEPIIFVHGWNANRTEWYYQRKFFEKDSVSICIRIFQMLNL